MISHSSEFNRYSIASAHLALSILIFSVWIITLLLFWYPSSFFSASGGWQGLRLVAAVDIVLGPLLTLIIYDRKKSRRELIIDLGVVVVLQLAALSWGIRAVYNQRPVAVVFLDSSFYTVPAADLARQGIDLDVLDSFSESSPAYVYVQRPDSGAELQRFTRQLQQDRIPPHEQVWLYQPLLENFETVRRSSIDIGEVMRMNSDMREDIERLLAESGSGLEDYYYLPLTSRYRNVVLVFDRQGRLQGTVNAPYKSGED